MEDKFNKEIRDKMQGYSSELDLEKFWNDLEPKLPAKKKRRFLLWWLWLPLLLGTPLAIFLWNIKTGEENLVNSLNKTESSIPEIGRIGTDSNNQSLRGSQIPEKSETAEPDQLNPKEKISSRSQNAFSHLDEFKRKVTHGQRNSTVKPHIPFNKEILAFDRKVESILNSTTTGEKNILNAKKNQAAQIDQSSAEKNQNQIHGETDRIDRSGQQEVQSSNSENSIEKEKIVRNSSESNQKDKHSGIVQENAGAENAKLPKISDTLILNDLEKSFENDKVVQSNSLVHENSFSFYLRPEVGVGGYFKKLSSSDDQLSMLIAERNTSESNLEEWLASLYLGLRYGKWSLESGVQFLQRNERFDYHQNKTSNNFGLTLADIEYSNGNRDSSFVEAWYVNRYSRKVIHYNKIQQWNIPLNMGVELYRVKNWSMGLQGGVLFSISNQLNGKLLNERLEISEIRDLELSKVRRTIGIGFHTGMITHYRLSGMYSLVAGLHYQYFNGSVFSGPVEQKYQSLNIRVGLQIEF